MSKEIKTKCSKCLFIEDRILRPHADPCKSCLAKNNNIIKKES